MQELWETGHIRLQGRVFPDGRTASSVPPPQAPIKLVAAGQSDRGMEFAAPYCDFNFALGKGVNEPTKAAGVPRPNARHMRQKPAAMSAATCFT